MQKATVVCISGVNGDMMITVLLLGEEPRVRQGLRMRLTREPDMTIIGEVGCSTEALALVQEFQPTVVLMDIALLDAESIAVITAIVGSVLILLSMYYDTATRLQTPDGLTFVGKQEGVNVLLAAIRRAAR